MRSEYRSISPRTESWHRWFAWYPVIIKDGIGYRTVWFEWVERRIPIARNLGVGMNGPLPTEYRLPEDVK